MNIQTNARQNNERKYSESKVSNQMTIYKDGDSR